jgi:hypothetical protein
MQAEYAGTTEMLLLAAPVLCRGHSSSLKELALFGVGVAHLLWLKSIASGPCYELIMFWHFACLMRYLYHLNNIRRWNSTCHVFMRAGLYSHRTYPADIFQLWWFMSLSSMLIR